MWRVSSVGSAVRTNELVNAAHQSWSAQRTLRFVRHAAWTAALLAVASQQAAAHSFLLSRGTVDVQRDRIVARLEINAADFIHYYRPRTTHAEISTNWLHDVVARHEQHLLDHFIVRDTQGERLRGRVVATKIQQPTPDEAAPPAVEPARRAPDTPGQARRRNMDYKRLRNTLVTYTLEFPTPHSPEYLTFQQRFGGPHPIMPVQLALAVRADGQPDRGITLTNGGNVETLRFARRGSQPAGAPSEADEPAPRTGNPLPADRFKTIHARFRIEDDAVRCDIYVPLVLVETWLPVRRADRDFIEPAEMDAAREALEAFLSDRNQVRIDGRRVRPAPAAPAFLGPEAASIADATPRRRLGAWSARVGVSLRYPTDTPPQRVDVLWGLFNGVVLNARATVECGAVRQETSLTTYEPTLHWARPPSP